MHCPTCGVPLKQALSYCNHCGANLNTFKFDSKSGPAETTTDTLVWVIVGTTITLLGMALGALVLMKNGSIHEGLGTAFVILSFAALVLVEGVLLWRLLGQNRVSLVTRHPGGPDDLKTEELAQSPSHVLTETADSVSTAAEQTTRPMKPSYRTGE
jgi:hypothetical protein